MLAAALGSVALAYEGYYRSPDVHGAQVVFSAEGDLWVAPVAGGSAARVTGHPGDERSAHFSPDGQWIAFTGEYDGNTDVFLMPAAGGEPRRLTWHPDADDCVGFTPDGRSVIVRSSRSDPNDVVRLFTVPVEGGDASELPIGWASRIDIDPATGRYAFTRLGRENATWKRYRGGSADDVWVGDPKTGEYRVITSFAGPDSYPMWVGDRLVFLSDQGGTANLWSMKPDGSDRKRLTDLKTGFDARMPSHAPDGRVVFVHGGELWMFDPKSAEAKKIAIDLPGDRRLSRARYTSAGASWFELSPDADRLLLTARGELFSVPVKAGVALPITRGSGARESYGVFSPDGKRVCYVTDATGEEAIVASDAWGRGDSRTVVPAGKKGWHFPPTWSPDGKRIAWADETFSLYLAGIDGTAAPVLVDKAEQAEIREYEWSPDGRYLAYSLVDRRGFASVWVYDTTDASKHRVGGTSTDAFAPAWDPDGRYLYFLSTRYTNPVMGIRDFSAVLSPEAQVFAVLLRPDVPNPFADNQGLPPAPENPQATAEKKKKEKKKKDKKEAEKMLDPTETPLTPVVIDWNGLADRVVKFPLSPGNYVGLAATASKVFVIATAWTGMNEPEADDDGAWIVRFDLEDKEGSEWISGISGMALAAKANQLAVEKDGSIYVVDANGGGSLDEAVDTSGVVVDLDPREEWRQIFFEAWRHERDFFWTADMGGVDWSAVRDRYATLLPRIATRYDLVDLIGEMIGELGTSHTYVWGGDRGVYVPWRNAGLLGADLDRVPLSPSPGASTKPASAMKVRRILRADPADDVTSPLLEPGVNLKEGDFIVAVNHQPIRTDAPFEAMLQGLAGTRVLLTVNGAPSLQGAREVAVTPAGDESALRHADWVRRNREYVSQKTGGKIGYLHVPDMGAGGLVAFETWLYPQSDKEGLVVDVRWNRGGFVSQLLLEKLRRPILGWDRSRGGGLDPYPFAQRRGPFVVLTNEFAGSDGDIFPKAVQVEGLAPVIGERSWGGVVGIRMDKPLVDGGALSQPEYAFWFKKGGWGVENHGVDPDIEIQWGPGDVARGVDTQLDRAIAEVVKLRDANPPLQPPGPNDLPPSKSRESYAGEK